MSLRNVGGDYVFKKCRRGSLRNVGGDYVFMKCRVAAFAAYNH